MQTRAIATLSVLALTAALASLPARAATGPSTNYDFTTREYDAYSAGEFDGRMHVNISPDGIVYGHFIDTEGRISDISGGATGTKIWFQIGNGSRIGHRYYDGTLVDGILKAHARGSGLHDWTFEGKPAKH